DPDVSVSGWYCQEKWFSAYQFSIKSVCGTSMWKKTRNQPPLPPILRKMPGRPKNRIKSPSKNNSQVSRSRRRMTCSNCLDPVPKTPKPRKIPGRKSQRKSVFYASSRGKGRGSKGRGGGRGFRGARAGRGGSGRGRLDVQP
ncbi:hypothetical protein Tco_0100325, partial [Tanacetum coccineum]